MIGYIAITIMAACLGFMVGIEHGYNKRMKEEQ